MSKREREFHRRAAASSFNRAWDYLDKKNRAPEDDLQMLHLVHASRYHWGLVGKAVNLAVGEWQISRVYAALGQPELALRFARSSLSICRENGLGETLPSAYEAIARAYAVAKKPRQANDYLVRARRKLDGLALGPEDRRVYLAQIEDTRRLIARL